jgi:hypothetical protein
MPTLGLEKPPDNVPQGPVTHSGKRSVITFSTEHPNPLEVR